MRRYGHRRRPDAATARRIPTVSRASGSPLGSEHTAPWNHRLLPGRWSSSPARPSDLALRPKLSQAIIVEPLQQVLVAQAAHFGRSLMFLADDHGFRSIGHGIHNDVGMGGDDELGALGGGHKVV